MIPLSSSNLRAVDYHPFTARLIIVFHGGGLYAYDRVPPTMFHGLLRAESPGRFFHAHIRNHYTYRRIR